jgi:hypothetical protein
VPSIFTINNVRENIMAHHDEIHNASEYEEVRLDACFERVISRKIKSTGFATPTIKKNFSIF